MLYLIPSPFLFLFYKVLGHFTFASILTGGLIAVEIDFRNQITLGSVIVVAVLLAIAGIFTIRSKIANIWREEAEGERAAKERLQEELNKATLDRSDFEKQQQIIRHDLKEKNATLLAQLKVMEAKTDLTAALDALREISIQQNKANTENHQILIEIRDKLPIQPILIENVEGDKR